MFLLFGKDHDRVGRCTRSTASRRSAVDGFIDCPPVTTTCTPSDRKIRPMPWPTPTATTPVVTRSSGGSMRADAARLAHPILFVDLFDADP